MLGLAYPMAPPRTRRSAPQLLVARRPGEAGAARGLRGAGVARGRARPGAGRC